MTHPAGSDPQSVNEYHASSDVDVGPLSQHHTLGINAGQSAAGNHAHNGQDGLQVQADVGLQPIDYPLDTMGDLLVVLTDGSRTYSRFQRGSDRSYMLSNSTFTPGWVLAQQPGSLAPVQAVSTSNININTPGAGLTIDGVSLNAGDRILLVNQTTGTENGIYNYNGNAPLNVPFDVSFVSPNLYSGMEVMCTQGTNYAATKWRLRNPTRTLTSASTQQWALAPGYKVEAVATGTSTTTSTTFGNLADGVTTSVTLWCGALQTVKITLKAEAALSTGGGGHAAQCAYSVSGTETVAVSLTNAGWESQSAPAITQEITKFFTTSNAIGNRTFTINYKTFSGADTATFLLRRIAAET